MTKYQNILWTIALVFVVSVASAFINAGGDMFNMTESGWQTIINAGVAAVLAFAVNAAVPWIKEYGYKGKKVDDPDDYDGWLDDQNPEEKDA